MWNSVNASAFPGIAVPGPQPYAGPEPDLRANTLLEAARMDRPAWAAEVRDVLAGMAGKRVVVIGDVMIDEWIWGRVSRISPEAPVPVVAVHDHSFTLGGSGRMSPTTCARSAPP